MPSKPCPACNGTVDCGKCTGTGEFKPGEVCPSCGGDKRCAECGGSGVAPIYED